MAAVLSVVYTRPLHLPFERLALDQLFKVAEPLLKPSVQFGIFDVFLIASINRVCREWLRLRVGWFSSHQGVWGQLRGDVGVSRGGVVTFHCGIAQFFAVVSQIQCDDVIDFFGGRCIP